MFSGAACCRKVVAESFPEKGFRAGRDFVPAYAIEEAAHAKRGAASSLGFSQDALRWPWFWGPGRLTLGCERLVLDSVLGCAGFVSRLCPNGAVLRQPRATTWVAAESNAEPSPRFARPYRSAFHQHSNAAQAAFGNCVRCDRSRVLVTRHDHARQRSHTHIG